MNDLSVLQLLLRGHLADLNPEKLRHEMELRNLVLTVRAENVDVHALETIALRVLRVWARHYRMSQSARYGLILWTTRHLPENADRVADWDLMHASIGGLDGWYLDYTGTAVAA